MKDVYGRELEDLRITLTHACNFTCFFCHMEGENDGDSLLSADQISLVAQIGMEFGIRTVKLTGGEPTLRRDLPEIISKLKEVGIKEVSMTTNGYLLKELAGKLKDAGLDRVNISLHSIDPVIFKEVTGVNVLSKVVEGIEEAKKVGLRPLKLNYVVTRKNAKGVFEFINFASGSNIDEIHLIELHPVGLGKEAFYTHVDMLDIEGRLNEDCTLIEIRNKHKRPRYKCGNLVVEVVKPYANPIFCSGCNRIRLTVDGKLKTCLYRDDKVIDISDIIKSSYSIIEKEELLREAYRLAILIREPNFRFKYETSKTG
ncbi:molybdenum cofactor biosynthesis protein MoaA [Sulfolobus acidocaldarius SUSAZ]|nr:molybdenum cofactor biosynthesis protein MoaA [Sulfolobus acidocaldarius SUSAZ]